MDVDACVVMPLTSEFPPQGVRYGACGVEEEKLGAGRRGCSKAVTTGSSRSLSSRSNSESSICFFDGAQSDGDGSTSSIVGDAPREEVLAVTATAAGRKPFGTGSCIVVGSNGLHRGAGDSEGYAANGTPKTAGHPTVRGGTYLPVMGGGTYLPATDIGAYLSAEEKALSTGPSQPGADEGSRSIKAAALMTYLSSTQAATCPPAAKGESFVAAGAVCSSQMSKQQVATESLHSARIQPTAPRHDSFPYSDRPLPQPGSYPTAEKRWYYPPPATTVGGLNADATPVGKSCVALALAQSTSSTLQRIADSEITAEEPPSRKPPAPRSVEGYSYRENETRGGFAPESSWKMPMPECSRGHEALSGVLVEQRTERDDQRVTFTPDWPVRLPGQRDFSGENMANPATATRQYPAKPNARRRRSSCLRTSPRASSFASSQHPRRLSISSDSSTDSSSSSPSTDFSSSSSSSSSLGAEATSSRAPRFPRKPRRSSVLSFGNDQGWLAAALQISKQHSPMNADAHFLQLQNHSLQQRLAEQAIEFERLRSAYGELERMYYSIAEQLAASQENEERLRLNLRLRDQVLTDARVRFRELQLAIKTLQVKHGGASNESECKAPPNRSNSAPGYTTHRAGGTQPTRPLSTVPTNQSETNDYHKDDVEPRSFVFERDEGDRKVYYRMTGSPPRSCTKTSKFRGSLILTGRAPEHKLQTLRSRRRAQAHDKLNDRLERCSVKRSRTPAELRVPRKCERKHGDDLRECPVFREPLASMCSTMASPPSSYRPDFLQAVSPHLFTESVSTMASCGRLALCDPPCSVETASVTSQTLSPATSPLYHINEIVPGRGGHRHSSCRTPRPIPGKVHRFSAAPTLPNLDRLSHGLWEGDFSSTIGDEKLKSPRSCATKLPSHVPLGPTRKSSCANLSSPASVILNQSHSKVRTARAWTQSKDVDR